ncbi:MAG: hypothetical protein ACI8XX_001561 [Polaribacter sp.]|jgi:hypothetical protein
MSQVNKINASELLQLIESTNHLKSIGIKTADEIKRPLPDTRTLAMHLVFNNLNY